MKSRTDHNPRCSQPRAALVRLEARGVELALDLVELSG